MSALPRVRLSRRPHLLQLVHAYPPAVGGVELSTRDLCERLVREHGFQVTVLTTNVLTVSGFRDPRLPRLPTGEETVNGVRVVRYPVQTAWARALRPLQAGMYRLRLPGNDLLRTWWSGPIAPGLRRAVRHAERVDVVCAASFPLNHMQYAFAAPAHRRPPVVLIGAVHTNDPWAYDRANLLRLVDRSFATVAHTEHEKAWLVEHGCSAAHVRVIGHGIDPGELEPRVGAFRAAHGIAADAFLVAYVGQQGAHKGLEVLLRSAMSVLPRFPSAWIAIAGATTPYSTELRRLANELPAEIRERIVIANDVSEQEKADVLGDCDVFVSASRAESFGITTLEAWSVGKPVIVGDAPSQREIVEDGVTGLIVAAGDADALSAAIVRLAEAPTFRARLGESGRSLTVTDYRRDVVERQYVDLFLEAMGAQGSGG